MLSLEILATTVVPAMALLFVGVIGFANLFQSVRKRFPIRVNCWFCNTNSRVPYESNNSWFCPSCTQYNGFTQDGDYNREIPEQYQCRMNPQANITDDDKISYSAPYNGLCFGCNRNQELKIHQLASFVPEVEENFDEEVDEYKRQLEQVYKLCSRCERMVKRTLNDVKRNILGSKLAQIGTKGLKVFDLHMQANDKQNAFMRRKTIGNVCLSAIIVLLLIKISQRVVLLDLSKKRLETILSPEVSQIIFIAFSYVVAIKDTILAQWDGLIGQPTVADSLNQLRCAKSLLSNFWDQHLNVSAAIVSKVLHQNPDIIAQRHSLPNVALICLAATLFAMKLHVGKLKPLVLIACSAMELLLETDYAKTVFGKQSHNESVVMLLVLTSLVTVIMCIGKTAPKIQPSDSVNSSFHKIYSQQGNDADCSETFDDNSSILQDASVCSRKGYPVDRPPVNISAKSMNTTKSISPSVLSASNVRHFTESSLSNQTHSPWSRVGGSVLNVNRLNTTFHEQSNRSFSRSSLAIPQASLGKIPSVSMDNFTTAIAGLNESVSLGHGLSKASLNNSTLVDDDEFGNDIDRLSISGCLSASRRNLKLVNNPFASHHVERDDICSLRQRKVTISPPQLGTLAESGSSWIAGGYWGFSPQKNHPDSNGGAANGPFSQPYMSRTSSQSSGFESQPTRRPTPEEPVGVDFDRVSLVSEPAGIFASNASSVSAAQHPDRRLNQTFHLPVPQSSPVPSQASFFGRPSNYSSAGRSLFGESNLFRSQHSLPPMSAQVFPHYHSQTGAQGMLPTSPGGGPGMPKRTSSTFGAFGGGNARRSLLNLSMLGGLAEENGIGD